MRSVVVLLALAAVACSSQTNTVPTDGNGSGSSTTASTSVPDDGSLGAKYINQRKCGMCHNQEGSPPLSGRTVKLEGYTNELYAPNLTPDPETGIGKWTDGQLTLAIREGVDNEGLTLCPQMQHYKTMGDDEVAEIIKYLRKLPPTNKKIPGSICPPLKG